MSAVISDCGLFRYLLMRMYGPGLTYLLVGVNPSTADAELDDSTIRKDRGFIQRWGGGTLIKANVYAYRSTDVRKLATATDPIGPDNDHWLQTAAGIADVIIPCWGAGGKLPLSLRPRLRDVSRLLIESGKPVKIFGLTQSGDPLHPLMLGYDTTLRDWEGYTS